MERKVIAANRASRGLSHLSTTRYVRGLNFWVRNGSRCFPSAMAAITRHPRSDGSQGPDLNRGVVDLQSTAWPLRHLGKPCYLYVLVTQYI